MKKKTVFLFALLCLLLNNSCRKNVIKIDPNYSGNWAERLKTMDCTLSITISSEGEGWSGSKTKLSDCQRYPTHDGKAKSDGKTLKIGFIKYKIVEKPTIIDTMEVITDFGQGKTIMRMQLDEFVLYKLL